MARWLPALAILSQAVPASAQEPDVARGEFVYYRCSHRANLGEQGATLTIQKDYMADGSVSAMSVQWEDSGGAAVRGPRASVVLHWPADMYSTSGGPLDWATGTITISVNSPEAYRLGRQEKWRQTFVDRNRSRRIYGGDDGTRYLMPTEQDVSMASGLYPLYTPQALRMGLDAFLLWGTGVPTLTVYETLAPFDRLPRRGYPNAPSPRRRLIVDYDVDVALIARRTAEIRQASTTWEAGIGDFRTACRREIGGGEIVVTDARIPRPDR
jgi:hypothetical protein